MRTRRNKRNGRPRPIGPGSAPDFSLLRGNLSLAVGAWDDVLSVRAFRRDELTTDTVYLAITVRDGSEFLAHQDATGWQDFLKARKPRSPDSPAKNWLPLTGTHARRRTLCA